MATKRKAHDEILEIRDDDDEGQDSDNDVEILEPVISTVTVEDDDDDDEADASAPSVPTKEEMESTQSDKANTSDESTKMTTPEPPVISGAENVDKNLTSASVASPVATGTKQQTSEAAGEKMDDSLPLLSLRFRDQQLMFLFKGSLSEYLKTTFQLKLGGQEVDVHHSPEMATISVMKKGIPPPISPPDPVECSTPKQKAPEPETPQKDDGQQQSTTADTSDMFVVDSTPAKTAKGGPIIPSYKKALSKVLDNSPTAVPKDGASKRPKPRQVCWNCDGDHSIRDCKEPKNYAKISKMKQEFMKKNERYHLDMEQKFGHITPGRLSDELRQALGLGKRDLPMHIYRMRLYGYPPGWLEEAKISQSGLQLFDSDGTPVQESDESEGEIESTKTKYDVRKIISFPGFNVDAGKQFFDDSKYHGVPPRLEHHSREEMIRNLEGTLVQGYRRKKLRMTSSARNDTDREAADMDLDNQDETFMIVDSVGECDKIGEPPNSQGSSLPSYNGTNGPTTTAEVCDEPEEGEVDDDGEIVGNPVASAEQSTNDDTKEADNSVEQESAEKKTSEASEQSESKGPNDSANDDSVILIEEETELICLDDSRSISPSLDDLRKKQLEILRQLENQSPSVANKSDATINEDSLLDDVLMAERLAEEEEEQQQTTKQSSTPSLPSPAAKMVINPLAFVFSVPAIPPLPAAPLPPPDQDGSSERPPEPEFLNLEEISMTKGVYVDDPGSMGLKTMSLGTPILTSFTPFNRLPCGEAFSKGVSDVINFENLPNSTGKYERMKSLLSKVRTVITAHNGDSDEEAR
ncbi:zinc finger CCHC domain-containing protein 8 homolog [Uranotaenia lowii]|uniref:zinc finger CCHC domain-containing protein 8 homolog n=1 Tax=Uranotaenia lowii TaxID=190385 RepID=UPI00247AA564|nr:zinc finger CCHC domain-containing protein 8 homolog [Uranotaenia lowii]